MTKTDELLLERLFAEVEKNFDNVVEWRRHLHANPELSFQEYETSAFIDKTLTTLGFNVQRNVGGTGLVALLEGGHTGKTIAFQADFDALPIQELKK